MHAHINTHTQKNILDASYTFKSGGALSHACMWAQILRNNENTKLDIVCQNYSFTFQRLTVKSIRPCLMV